MWIGIDMHILYSLHICKTWIRIIKNSRSETSRKESCLLQELVLNLTVILDEYKHRISIRLRCTQRKIDSLSKQYEESLKTQHGNEYAGVRQCLDAEKCFFTAFNQKIRRSASNSGAFHTSTSFRQQKLRGKVRAGTCHAADKEL